MYRMHGGILAEQLSKTNIYALKVIKVYNNYYSHK